MNIGIDLGTTYSVAAYVDENDNVKVIPNAEGDNSTPSVVLFEEDKSIIVGEEAKNSSFINADDVVIDAKSSMGKNVVLMEKNGKKYTPEQISSFIIRKLVGDSEKAIGEDVDGVVITVPASFSDAKRKATEDAARMAGVNLIGMINEPTAAAICYIKAHDIKNEKIMIYDLGGGTFDVTILDVKDYSHIDVLSTDGISNAGGRFFDNKIVNYVYKYIKEKYDVNLRSDGYEDDLQELIIHAEEAKISLSAKQTANIVVKTKDIKEKISITREQFNGFIKDVYLRTEVKIEDALKLAELEKEDIDRVLMVGGSSRIPFIYDSVKSFMGKEPSNDIHPDEAVALGAAIYCGFCENDTSNFTDVCSHSIGVVVYNGERQENEIIIPKNSQLPISSRQKFRTMQDRQKIIELTVTEGEDIEVENVNELGKVTVNLPENVKKNDLVVIEINLDKKQLVNIKLELPDYDFVEDYHMKRTANLSEEDVIEYTGILKDYTVR
ncbi:MAG: Hsp70 family protein [Lachnospiraceae bacterium]|nr:Hsp70 family protein [Lachnospiraceae bacterium]